MNEQNTNASGSEKQNNNWLLPASILIAGLIIAGAVIYSTGAKNINQQQANNNPSSNDAAQQNTSVPTIDSNDPVLGNPNASLTLIEFGDFQCPFCAKFYQEIEKPLQKDYIDTGKVKMVYKPLAFLDSQSTTKESEDAVNAVECAQEQGKFWEMHDAIFDVKYADLLKAMAGKLATTENIGDLNKALFTSIASNLKINVGQFVSCYDSGKHKNDYQAYMKEGGAVMPQGIGTPAVFLNGQKVELSMNSQGEFDYASFSKIIDAALKNK